MSLDNKVGGDKHYAFEVNNVTKAIRQAYKNIIEIFTDPDINRWEYISSEAVSAATGSATTINDTGTLPSNANRVVLVVSGVAFTNRNFRTQLTADAQLSPFDRRGEAAGLWYEIGVAISGSVVTVTMNGSTTSALNFSGTLYYYT